MKKENFIKAIETFQSKVVIYLKRRGVEDSLANDSVQDTVVSLLENKAYQRLEFEAVDGRAFSFMKKAAKAMVGHALRKEASDNDVFVSINYDTEKEAKEKVDIRERVKEEQECPYCHDGALNMYKACGQCGTILGQGRGTREHISIDEADLLSLPDLDMSIDVAKAIAELEPLEQKVIQAIANGTDTLDGLADSNGMSRDTLWRTYVKAKKKLQASLIEYAY